jgi:hypothetical protein
MPEDVALTYAWVPADQYELALARWPGLLREWSDRSHREHSRFIELRLRDLRLTGRPIAGVAPIRVDDHETFCRERDLEPDASSSRARHAAEIALLGRALPWPPKRNDRCWCGSGRKYKLCCGAAAPDHLSITREELLG